MSEPTDDEQRRLAPGVAKAMRAVRNPGALIPPAHRRRWGLPAPANGPTSSPPEDVGVGWRHQVVSGAEHQIEAVWFDDDAGCAVWRCGCGYDADGYGDVGEARYAAAEHQLPEHLQREIEESTDSVEQWREAVLLEAEDAAAGDPHAWSWWRAAAG